MNSSLPEQALRRPIFLVAGLAALVAIAPWFSGGQDTVARVITATVLLLAVLLLWRQPNVARFNWRSPLVLSGLTLGVWGALSLLWSVNAYHSILWLLGLSMAMVTFSVVYRLSTTSGGRWWLQRGYLLVALLFALYGFWLFFTSDYERLTSSLYWANPAAGLLLPAFIVGLSEMGPGIRKTWWAWPFGLVVATAFWTTQSRAATLVLILGVVALIALQRRNRAYIIRIIVALAASYMLSTICVQVWHVTHPKVTTSSLGSRFAQAAQGESTSGSDRIKYLSSAVHILRDYPILGTGAGTYEDAHPKYQERVISASSDAHNWYVQTLSELGIVGGLLLIGLAIALIMGVIRRLRAHSELLPWVIGALAFALHLGLDIDGQYPALLALVAFLLALVWQPVKPAVVGRISPLPILVLIAAVVLVAQANTSHITALRGAAAQANNDYAGAASAYADAQKTLVYDPSVLIAEGINYYSLAVTKVDPKVNFAKAINSARLARKLMPLDAQNYQLEGRSYLAQYKLGNAETAFIQALKGDPYNQPSYAQDLAIAYRDSGHAQKGIEVTSAMLAQYPASVLSNRHDNRATIIAVLNLWNYQQYLHSETVNDAAAKVDRDNAEAVKRSLSTN